MSFGVLQHILQASYLGSYLLARWKQVVQFRQVNLTKYIIIIFILDILLGLICASVVGHFFSAKKMLEDLLWTMDLVVKNLQQLISWLMGAPAGLKLNSVLSQALGKFFLYHIHLWVTFLILVAPYVAQFLEVGVTILPFVGVCFQLTLAQDTFNLITFHIHCFYAYARRLFFSQTEGLQSLWRLFRGKKFNPLRKRVDSSINHVDQLFVGTLAFTILLFLYPTTLTYFVVFKMLELLINGVHYIISYLVRSVMFSGGSDLSEYQETIKSTSF